MKRGRLPSSSEDSDGNGSHSTSWSQQSRSQQRRNSWSTHDDRKPSEVFRTDLITAMKLHDSHQLNPDDYYILADAWRQEWEKGVQVPVNSEAAPEPGARAIAEKEKRVTFVRPRKYILSSGSQPPEPGYVDIRTLAEGVCRYDLDDVDVAWRELVNEELQEMGMNSIEEYTMERVMEIFEQECYDNLKLAIESEEGLGIEYDEDVVCDVCQSPEGEDGNEMVFCDKCNICVHQACYGILKVPEGSWLCRTCALGVQPKCLLCPKKGGAMKPTRSGTKWVHVSCALWIPEVSIGSPEKMEPITKVSHISSSRWALTCSLCSEKTGACIQCSAKYCRTAFHVTCAFAKGLEMKTILTENDEVKFKSYCLNHSTGGPEGVKNNGNATSDGDFQKNMLQMSVDQNQQETQRLSSRKQKLQQLEDDFYTFVNASKVAQDLQLTEEVVDFIYQYWKMKRKANFNKPLITPKKDEEDNLAKQEQDVLFRRLKLFTHLRQDLERVRNLTYMLTRREKMKRSICKVQEQIFNLQVKLLEQEKVAGEYPFDIFPIYYVWDRVTAKMNPSLLAKVASEFTLNQLILLQVFFPNFSNKGLPLSVFPESVQFTWIPQSAQASHMEDFKWQSFIMGKEHLHSSERHSAKVAQKKDKVLTKKISMYSDCNKSDYRNKKDKGTVTQGSHIAKENSEAVLASAQQRNGLLVPEHRKRRDNQSQSEEPRFGLREKGSSKERHRPLRSTELQSDNRGRTLHLSSCSNSKSFASGIRKPSGDTVTKCNGSINRSSCKQIVVKVPRVPTGPVKNWGGFKIPKKGERQHTAEMQLEVCQDNKDYQFSMSTVKCKESAKNRLKTDIENDGYTPDAEMSDSEIETKKKCRPHRLSTNNINRRYETNIIRRSILAS
ncbi:protein Jade-1 [Protopterus annectens]|uniref:protein Jade-1 n=1 Tax=Protopterus annectens TaxID=7888 RepID=UPI001CFB7C10|nr:protein Jade-1 [Protopterus annectens]